MARPDISIVRIEPEMLHEDNLSAQAGESRNNWKLARRRGELTGVRGCADARILIGDPLTTRVRTIAAAGPEMQ